MDAAGVLAKSGEALKSGPIGLAIILILCIACYFLFKSMSRHLRTVREDFPTDEPPAAAPADVTERAESSAQTAQPTQTAQPVDPAPSPPAE